MHAAHSGRSIQGPNSSDVVLCATTVEVEPETLDHAQREYFPPVPISELRYSPIVPLKLCSRLELLGAPPPSRRRGSGWLVSPEESVGHLAVEAVVGGHRGQRGVVGQGDGAVHGRRGAVVGQLQVHAGVLFVATTPSSTSKADWSALLETRGQRALQRGDAASVRGHLSVRGGQGRRRGQKRNCRRQRAAVQLWQLCGDSVVQGLDGRCVVAGRCSVYRQVHLSVGRQSEGQLPCGDVRAVSHLSVVQDLRDIAGNRSFKHVYICSRRLSPLPKAAAKELSASYSARGSIPAASAVEYHSVRPEVSAKRGRLRGFGLSEAGSAASVLERDRLRGFGLGARTRPAPGPHKGYFRK